jgi:diacylglycerol kinase (ATP)
VVLTVIAAKAVSHRGTPMSGGLPSGHAAVAFASFTAVVLSTGDNPHHVLIASLALLMALLVAQTRVEAGVHSVSEVVLGGILGLAVTLLVFQLVR